VSAAAGADLRWLAAAARMARPWVGTTGRNPTVGALVVDPATGRVFGRGVTAPGGKPHAEPPALAMAGNGTRGATLYVTLEPCHHSGSTPPCVEAVIAAGIGRVVMAMPDPDPRTAGRSAEKLRQSGIEVLVADPAELPSGLHEGYLMRRRQNRPFVAAKLAVSADGMIGRRDEANVPVTGDEARRFTHVLRSRHDAILVGAATARLDDPRLDVRVKGMENRSPRRWVALGERAAEPRLRLFSGEGPPSGVILADAALAAALPPAIERLVVSPASGAGIDWSDALARLGGRGTNQILVEGGAAILHTLLDAGLVDRFYLLESGREIGVGGVSASPGGDIGAALGAAGLCVVHERPLGGDRVTVFERAR